MNVAAQIVTEDLRRWIAAQTKAGCRSEDLLDAMRASGWEEGVASGADPR